MQQRSGPSFFYVLGMFFVTVGMVLLPILYLSLVAALAYGVYWFFVHAFFQIWEWPIGGFYGNILKLLCSVTPLLAGSIAALFLIKPLFHIRTPLPPAFALSPETEPQIYEFCQSISQIVGSPAPIRIEVDCMVNASASFEKGRWFNNKLVLRLGMPLAASLSIRELAGVIAHEFGHFRQGAGMRLSFVIRAINHWFYRVVHVRDGMDEALEGALRESESWMTIMLTAISFFVWLTRGILWVFMMAGNILSSFMLRQMEYDADAWEIFVGGSAGFESTTCKLAVLNALNSELHFEMRRQWRNSLQLPDNIPLLLQQRYAALPQAKKTRLENEACLGETGLFDTHPSNSDRIWVARQAQNPGCEIPEGDASLLFSDFAGLEPENRACFRHGGMGRWRDGSVF